MALAVKPLKQLLELADELIKGSQLATSVKEASAQVDEASTLTSLLARADAPVTVSQDSCTDTSEIDKLAESINRFQTAIDIEEMYKIATFESKALSEGYTKEQVKEAVAKISAAKLKKDLPILAATSMFVGPGTNANDLPVIQKMLAMPRKDLTKSQGC